MLDNQDSCFSSDSVIQCVHPERTVRLESENLLIVLGEFENAHLDPLVTLLNEPTTLSLGTRLKEEEAFKAHAPDHRHYRAEIARDLCRWGSHEILNAREPASYRDVVNDVCRKSNVTITDGMPVIEMERRLLNKVRADGEAASPANGVVGQLAGLAGGGALMGLGQLAVRWGAPRLLGAVGGPVAVGLAAAWTAWEALGPGYRVTIPCVLVIAETRLRLWSEAVADTVEF